MALILLSTFFIIVSAAPVLRGPSCPVLLPTHATPRIVGGDEASPHTRSHVVSFFEEGCGGSLLSETWVLTAAHCLVHESSVARIAGSNSSDGVAIPVKRVFNHPDYKFPEDDITLVELESPAPSSASFMAVNSNPSVPEDGEFARVAGYGFLGEGFDDDHDAMLRQVDVPVMNTTKCIGRYFSVHSYLREDISVRKHICAGYDAGGCDSCTADSGGPLFVYDEQNSPVQIALVSFGYGCAREVPGGYTRISTYVSWMKSIGAVFQEKTTRKAVFGETVSAASGPEPEKEEPADATEAEGEEEREPEDDVGEEDEEDEEPRNENSSEPAPDHPSNPTSDSATSAGSTTQSGPLDSQAPTDSQGQPDADETRPGPGSSPKPSPKPSLKPSLKPSANPSLKPSANPSLKPSAKPSLKPSAKPSLKPSANTSAKPSLKPSAKPSLILSPEPSPKPSSQSPPESSPNPSPPGRLPPNNAVGVPTVDEPPASNDYEGEHGGEGRPKPSENGSNASNGNGDIGDDSGGVTGSEDGGEDNDADSEDIEGENAETVDDVKENDVGVAATSGDPNKDEEATDKSPQNVAASPPENSESADSAAVNNFGGDGATPVSSDDDDTKAVTGGSDNADDEDNTGNIIGPVVVPGQSPAPSFQIGSGDLEEVESSGELEASSSPEISESPEDANAAISELGDANNGLSGLQISMIVVGSVLAIMAVGYLTYFVIQKVM